MVKYLFLVLALFSIHSSFSQASIDSKNLSKNEGLFGFEIQEERSGKYLVDITDFLIRDGHGVAETLKIKDQGVCIFDESAINNKV